MTSIRDRGDSGSGVEQLMTLGSVPTHASEQKGTGYDATGHVSTAMGHQDIGYDPETGTASMDPTTGQASQGAQRSGSDAPLSSAADKQVFHGDLDPDGKQLGGHGNPDVS